MISSNTVNDRSGVEAALAAVRAAIDDIPAEGFTGRDLAEAFLEMAVMSADHGVGRAGVARRLVDIAERLLAAERITSKREPRTETDVAHGVLAAAVETLSRSGQSDSAIRYSMIAYVAAWTAKAEGKTGAEVFYRYADAMVGRGGAACH